MRYRVLADAVAILHELRVLPLPVNAADEQQLEHSLDDEDSCDCVEPVEEIGLKESKRPPRRRGDPQVEQRGGQHKVDDERDRNRRPQ